MPTEPGAIVIACVGARLFVLAAAPASWNYSMAGFVLFRRADILKLWTVSWADREVRGGLGIMLDDLLAALYAGVILYGIWLLFN